MGMSTPRNVRRRLIFGAEECHQDQAASTSAFDSECGEELPTLKAVVLHKESANVHQDNVVFLHQPVMETYTAAAYIQQLASTHKIVLDECDDDMVRKPQLFCLDAKDEEREFPVRGAKYPIKRILSDGKMKWEDPESPAVGFGSFYSGCVLILSKQSKLPEGELGQFLVENPSPHRMEFAGAPTACKVTSSMQLMRLGTTAAGTSAVNRTFRIGAIRETTNDVLGYWADHHRLVAVFAPCAEYLCSDDTSEEASCQFLGYLQIQRSASHEEPKFALISDAGSINLTIDLAKCNSNPGAVLDTILCS